MLNEALLQKITVGIRTQPVLSSNSIVNYRHLVRQATANDREISIWSDAIEAALSDSDGVYLPDDERIYYLDRPIYLSSGQTITAGHQARIYATDGLTTCMVRNKNIKQFPDDAPGQFDRHISVSGGIWSVEKQSRSSMSGRAEIEHTTIGAQGTFIFSNVSDLVLTNLKFEKCSAFAVQISNAENLFISDIVFDVFADGIHLNGPLKHAIVQNLTGQTGDDFVALNAWDWQESAITFGPIENVLVQNIHPHSGHKAMRFLAGVKTYPDASTRDCPIEHVIVRQIKGVNEYKLYAQPEVYIDYPDGCVVGKINDLYFCDIDVEYGPEVFPGWNLAYDYRYKRGLFEILAHIERISFERIRTDILFSESAPALIDVGPKSATLRIGSDDPQGWREVFLPNGSCVVDEIELADIYGISGKCTDPDLLVREIRLSVNENYPITVPRGGIGAGKVKHITL